MRKLSNIWQSAGAFSRNSCLVYTPSSVRYMQRQPGFQQQFRSTSKVLQPMKMEVFIFNLVAFIRSLVTEMRHRRPSENRSASDKNGMAVHALHLSRRPQIQVGNSKPVRG